MQARERRRRHFKSSVGSMLNENYGSGLLPDTVSNEDFLYIPTTSLPLSSSALQFLEHKFPEPPAVKPTRGSTSESLNKAYYKALGQPHMMVHYDRDPFFRASKRSLEKDLIGTSESSLQRETLLARMEKDARLVPKNISPASTPQTVSSAASSGRNFGSSLGAKFRSGSTNSETRAQMVSSSENKFGTNDHLSRNKHRLWTPGSEAAGFKPYTPFSDSLYDFGKKEAKFIAQEIQEEIEYVPPPKYKDAFNKVMDYGITDAHQKRKGVDILKVHGNPEYPDKVMKDNDIPNYVAWTQIFPYCPLTQVDGKNTPVKIPPRGFTPSTASSSSPTRQKNMSEVKKEIFAGIQQEQVKGVTKRKPNVREPRFQSPQRKNKDERNGRKSPSLQGLPVPPPPSLASKLLQHQQKLLQNTAQHGSAASTRSQTSSVAHTELSGHVDTTPPRRRLAMKVSGPEEYYTGHTPSCTPTPDHTLPIKPSKAWLKHYSPQRIRHFLAITAEPRVPVG
ncbi:hypothetical protein ElyMa_000025100 [Elysia marginata]|uniref:Uncharacterized protein n=1 Tax=Elysia marginata TaxID=1093978 RepID=A0AAV4EBW5_9GAST|nr:hypothetical protein ElyMa_000025100 [Elysia marginata]